MLILTRKENESIRIGDDVEVFVKEISGNRVVVGIKAPRDVLILRSELPDQDQREVADGP